MVVQHNLTAMNSNRMLGLTASAQAKSTEKLSSGYKINRAADDAAGLAISEKMRKQIRGLTQASLNAQDGISAVQTAEGALNEVQDMLQRMNELAVKAANGTNSESDRTAIQNEIDQLTTEIDRVSETTKFNETYLLKGGEGDNVTTHKMSLKAATATEATESTATFGAGVDKLYKANGDEIADEDALKAYLDADPDAKVYKDHDEARAGTAATDAAKGGDGKATVALYGADGTKLYDIGDDISSEHQANMGALYTEAPAEAKGKNEAGADDYTYTAGTAASTGGLYNKNGEAITAANMDDYFEVGEDGSVSIKEGAEVYTNADHTAALNADDISDYVDVKSTTTPPALSLNLHVGADATDNNQIGISIDSMSAASLGVDGLKIDGADDTNARNAIDTIKDALQKVSDQRAALGAVQNRLEHTISNLDNVVENTTAAESQIRDTDMATEMVKFSNNNILAQAGQSMLAQANQSNQGVLSLLG